MQYSTRPETRGSPEQISVVALQLAPGVSTNSVASAVAGTSVMTSDDVAMAIPGVKQQRSTLTAIVATTLIVAVLVVALFFALVVLEKRELFAVLKALGTSTGRLARGVVVQAVVASVCGVVIGSVIAQLVGLVVPGQIPTLFRGETLLTVAGFTVLAGVFGALFSLRRIARIDPATALGGANS